MLISIFIWHLAGLAVNSKTIALVEDDDEIGRMVRGLLEREGYTVHRASCAAAFDAIRARITADLFVLDVMLPGEDGLSLCRRIRTSDQTPILMLTARGDEIDRVIGLEVGADDYLVKPFGPRELVARVRALLRRAEHRPVEQPNRCFSFGNFIIDVDGRSLQTRDAIPVSLTSAEFDLLNYFIQRPRRVLSRDSILDAVRGRSAEPFDRTVDMLISRLRRKLDQASPSHVIATVRNGGYLLTVPVTSL